MVNYIRKMVVGSEITLKFLRAHTPEVVKGSPVHDKVTYHLCDVEQVDGKVLQAFVRNDHLSVLSGGYETECAFRPEIVRDPSDTETGRGIIDTLIPIR